MKKNRSLFLMLLGLTAAPAFAMPGDLQVDVRGRPYEGRQVAKLTITGYAAEQLYSVLNVMEMFDPSNRSYKKEGRDLICYRQMIAGVVVAEPVPVYPGRPGYPGGPGVRPGRPGFPPPPVAVPSSFSYSCFARVNSQGEVELPRFWRD